MKHNDYTIKSVIECQKAITRLLGHDQSVPRGSNGAIHCSDIIDECRKPKFDDASQKKFDGASQWSHEDWISTLARGGAKKIFQSCLNPCSSSQFLYVRAIQGHSGDNVVDPALQDNVLLPKGFTDYLCHVGNGNDLNSTIRIGLIPGGTSLKRGRQAVSFTTVNPMEDVMAWVKLHAILRNQGSRHTRILGNAFKKLCWCILKLAQERGLQFYQTRSHAVVLYNTLPAACIEKAVCMKTQDELYQKVRLTPRVPRVVFKSNSQYGLQDPQNQEARSSWEPSIDSKSHGEICNNTVDHRISGVPLSAVEQKNTIRENKVKRLIEKFENHKHKESFIQDLSQTQKINKFSKESQDLIADMNNTKIFKLCDNSSKQQCPDYNAYWEMGIICCSCGRNTQSTRNPTEFDQNNRDVTSIPGAVVEQSTELLKDKRCTTMRNRCLKKARQGKHGGHPTILSRWYACDECRKSLSDIGWREHHIILYDRIALDKRTSKPLQELNEFRFREIGF